jgi:lysophospholipase L1-like esterase
MKRAFILAILLLAILPAHALAYSPGASSSSNNGPTAVAANAFDGNLATYWQGDPNYPGWGLDWTYASQTTVTSVRVIYAGSLFISANAWLQCTTDGGATWTRLATVPVAQDTGVLTFPAIACTTVDLEMDPASGGVAPAVSEETIGVGASATPTATATAAPTATPAATPTTPSGTVNYSVYMTIGDSITAGSYSPFAWPTTMRAWRTNTTWINVAQSGTVTSQWLGALPGWLTNNPSTQMVMFTGGINDIALSVPESTTLSDITQMVGLIRNAGKEPFMIQLIPSNDGITNRALVSTLHTDELSLATSLGVRKLDPWPLFDNATHAFATCPVTATYTAESGLTTGYQSEIPCDLSDDGTHPNGKGALVMANAVRGAFGWPAMGLSI